MPIAESDISILIPTYRYRDKVGRAVESALASGAGEIVVTDDHSGDGTIEFLAKYAEPRLRVYENERNLGLWENHLVALQHATKPWIKFIQADDYLLPGGLAAYAAAVAPQTSVVWGCPVVRDDTTGQTMQFHELSETVRLSGEELLNLCLYVGWLLGTPSHMMLRNDAIARDPSAWSTEISADLVNGTIAAVQGEVVLLPPGAIGQGAHDRQDAKTEGYARGLQRMVGSPSYLSTRTEPALQRFAKLWAKMNERLVAKVAAIGTLRRRVSPLDALRLVRANQRLTRGISRLDRARVRDARAYRRTMRIPQDISAVLDAHRGKR